MSGGFRAALFLSSLLLVQPLAWAGLVGEVVGGEPITPLEDASVEPTCRAIGLGRIDGFFWLEGLKRAGQLGILERPENAMALNAPWFHHYCWGKLAKFRYFAAKDEIKRDFYAKTWRSEMDYVIKVTVKAGVEWTYLPVIYGEIAEVYYYNHEYSVVVKVAEESLKLDSSYVRTYVLLSDAYAKLNDRAKALDWATRGLNVRPDSKALNSRYKELGGVQPFSPPVRKEPSIPADSAADAKEIGAPPPPGNEQETTPSEVAPASAERPTTKPAHNRYCRFCPD